MNSEDFSLRKLDELGLLVSDQITAMLAYWDKDLISRFANNAYREWFGKTREEMINKMHISELLGPILYEKNLPYIIGALSGEKQVFEREIPIPGGNGTRHSLTTYIPDLRNKEVIGFFVHVADVTHVKNLENEIIKAKREILRNIIATEENNNRYLTDMLRESINQRLAACKLMMEEQRGDTTNTRKEVNAYLSETIREVNAVCEELTPSEIEIFGLVKSLNIHIEKYLAHSPVAIEFTCNEKHVERLSLNDKLSIFRILQNLIRMYGSAGADERIQVNLLYNAPRVNINLIYHGKLNMDKNSKEYKAIECRTEYYGGTIAASHGNGQTQMTINFLLTNE
jgi:PAS domain S-box-containing protein